MSIQKAMLDYLRTHPQMSRLPVSIPWQGKMIKTADAVPVGNRGRFQVRFLSANPAHEQAVDVSVEGAILLPDGSKSSLLRTICDNRLEEIVEYEFTSNDGLLRIWNSYRVQRGTKWVWEKMTGNAGFWSEEVGGARIYHCSVGPLKEPDFESFVFELRIK
jgi:hypothetical protein